MPRIVGSSVRVVDTGKMTIDELAGNVATKDDRISIALSKANSPTSEPWLTLHYDEWMCVLKGRMVLLHSDGQKLEVVAGQTVLVESGERFRPTFPDGDCEYVPVCIPAFRPDRCIREEENGSDVSTKLQELHGGRSSAVPMEVEETKPEVLYHMCQRQLWEAAKASGEAYFPPTFEADGFTHGTAVPSRLIATANHFYQDVVGDWVCLQFRRSALRRLGIVTRDERAMPVGEKSTSGDFNSWICPHIFGGIPPQVVDAEFPMEREGATFNVIRGLTDLPRRIFKLASASDVGAFKECGRIQSGLDRQDGFVHLSDRNAAPVVAAKFFADCQDLQLIEVDAERLPGPVRWVVGNMGDPDPASDLLAASATTVHYLRPDGCVHVFGKSGVPTSAIVREVAVPFEAGGARAFPDWF